MVCTHTLYNEVWAGSLDLSVTELPEAMKRKQHKGSKPREHKKSFGTDISQRPEIAALRIEEGHWEGDTVVGKRAGKEAVVLSLLEKKTENYIAIRIPGKDADSVLNAMQSLREEFGDKFSQGQFHSNTGRLTTEHLRKFCVRQIHQIFSVQQLLLFFPHFLKGGQQFFLPFFFQVPYLGSGDMSLWKILC